MSHDSEIEDTWTFATTERGDIRMNQLNTVDIATAERAVVQDLKVALSSEMGDDPLDPEFGLDLFTALRSVPFLRRELKRCIEYDDKNHNRVQSVVAISIFHVGGRDAEIKIAIRLHGSEIFQLLFRIPRAIR